MQQIPLVDQVCNEVEGGGGGGGEDKQESPCRVLHVKVKLHFNAADSPRGPGL